MGIFSEEIEAVESGYYKAKESSHPENRILVSIPHYLFVRGSVRCYGQKTEDLIQIDIIQKCKEFDYWRCLISKKNISLEQLSFYEKIDEAELPWNNGEKTYEETAWSDPEVQRKLRRFLH